MSIEYIVSSYLVPVSALIFLIALILINPLFEKKQTILFLLAAAINLALIFSTSLDYILAKYGMEELYVYRRITTFMNFSLGPLIPIMLLKIFDQSKFRFYTCIPFAINFLLSFVSIFWKIIFYISPQNTYGRGALFFVPFVTTLIYLMMLILQPVSHHGQSGKKYERTFLLTIIALLFICMYLEVGFGLYFLNYSCSALALIMYYLLLNIQGYSLDPLTGIYNRIKYNKMLAKVSQGTGCTIALIDINNFKELNDTQGHAAGDQCLIHFSALLCQYTGQYGTVYRIGGDEFVVLSTKLSEEDFSIRIAVMQKDILKENISFSYGTAAYLPGEDLEETIKLADHRMYQNKKMLKSENS